MVYSLAWCCGRSVGLFLTEVDPGAVTLTRPVDVLYPSKVRLKFFRHLEDSQRHRAVVVSDENEP
jgi:hypothetical protein